jgi:hypothetical protein
MISRTRFRPSSTHKRKQLISGTLLGSCKLLATRQEFLENDSYFNVLKLIYKILLLLTTSSWRKMSCMTVPIAPILEWNQLGSRKSSFQTVGNGRHGLRA